MTKQLFTLLSIVWVFVAFANGGGKSMLYKAEEQKDNFKVDLISKLQETKSGNYLTCNLRLKNTSGEIKFVESIDVIIEIEAKNLKNDKKEILKKSFTFNEEWIIADEDYAFYQPLNQTIENKDEYVISKIVSCKIDKFNYGTQPSEEIKGKLCPFNKEETLGLVESVIVKANFQKEADRSPGYYKNGLDLNTVGHAVKIHCTLNLDNSSPKAIKLKEDVVIGIKVGNKSFFKKIKPQKLRSRERRSENLFSIHFSDKLKSELPKAEIKP